MAVLPGAGPADWSVMRRDGETVEYHAATLPLELFRSDTEAYMTALSSRVPSIGVVMRPAPDAERPMEVALVTASPFEIQDYMDSGEELVELVPMPDGLRAFVEDFTMAHHVDEEFVKRRRNKSRVDQVEDGKGDARIRQVSDVYRAPRKERTQ